MNDCRTVRVVKQRRGLSVGPTADTDRGRIRYRKDNSHMLARESRTCMTVPTVVVSTGPYKPPFLAVWIIAQALGCFPLANLDRSETRIPPRSVICEWSMGLSPMFGRPSSKIRRPQMQLHASFINRPTPIPIIPPRYPLTHSQWHQDLSLVLPARLRANWPLLRRNAPLSLLSALLALASQLPPRLLSPPSSSRREASRPSTLLAPRRPSMVSFGAIERVD